MRREARRLLSAPPDHHPNVCSVLDFDEHHGTYYLVMEFLSGQTLTTVHNRLLANAQRG